MRIFKTRWSLIPLVVLLLVSGAFAWTKLRSDPKKATSSQAQTANSTQDTYTATSEGKQFQVPADVPQDAIKNYTLINENEQYKIRSYQGEYTITLYAIINNPSQYSMYQDQLREYKQSALGYLKGTGVDISKAKIIYEPDEAKNL
jgi:hypothetical protein